MQPVRLLAAGALMAMATAAFAQPGGDAPQAVLFDQPNFQGRSITIAQGSANLEAQAFAAMAMSGRFDGDWTLCDRPAWGGRCRSVAGDVTDLAQMGLSRRIVSLRHLDGRSPTPPAATDDADGYFDRPNAAAGGEGRAVPNQGVAGHGVVFFYRPQRDGADIPGDSRELADGFCRDQGYGPAAYWDTDGRILRDVLCRRD